MGYIMDNIESILYEKIFARNEFYAEKYTMSDAWNFFMKCAGEYEKVKGCMFDIEPKEKGYKISLLMLDDSGMPVYADENNYVGRVVKAKAIGDDVRDFMKGERRKVLERPY